MKNTIKVMFFAVALMFSAFTMAQSTVTGTVMDADLNSPLPSASVVEKGTSNGTTTDFDGNFTLTTQSNSGVIEISYVGYGKVSLPFSGNTNLGNVSIASENALEEIVIVGTGVIDLAEGRQTPIAVSTIRAKEIQEKIGSGDITTSLVNTPSVYVAGQSGGFGDSRIAVRGFEQDNTAFLLNGQPINGMEDGKMYWSNWSGMNDVANGIQIQRGLGSSKLAISSVGGTVNFVTKTTDKREGGFVKTTVGNNNYLKTTASYSTGLMENGFGVTALLTHWQGDGYNMGTFGEGQTYFLSFGYKPNETHNFNFLVTGAPQWHDQNFSKSISTYLEKGRKYNDNYGYLGNQYLTERRNFYHKPVANLNWDYTINDNMNLSTVLYASWGRGGGTGGRGNKTRTADGLINYNAIHASNNAIANGEGGYFAAGGGYVTRASMNLHSWYGLVTNLEVDLSENLTLNTGLDLRTYQGTHFRQVENFHGLTSWQENIRLVDQNNDHQTYGSFGTYKNVVVTEGYAANPWTATFNTVSEDQRIAWDYGETINYGGLFAQLEYANDNLSVFFQGAASNQSHQRTDRYQYADNELISQVEADTNADFVNPDTGESITDGTEAEKVSNFGYNVKAGAGYIINENNNVYVNAGYYSRQPYHDNIYLNFTNQVNPLTENEKIFGLEAGYGYSSPTFSANLNLYRTSWKDRVTTSSDTDGSDNLIFITNEGVEQLHSGVELDFTAKVMDKLRLKGFASMGNWEYVGNSRTTTRDEENNVLSFEEEDVDGGKVGDAAQFTAGLGFVYQVAERFSVDADYRYNDNLYADVGAIKENLELPSFDLMDLGLSYKMLLGESDNRSMSMRLNVNNVFDSVYISELSSANQVEAGDESFNGINVNNRGYFGLGRTWNFSVRYNF
ncbi:TonB-dependent receptor [Olleya sp. R77988]|uniref:TonB-dependent receptor n=1 Tax=Olleya sp. R77988 TaxID=3093875 RepID=UPI0037C9A526